MISMIRQRFDKHDFQSQHDDRDDDDDARRSHAINHSSGEFGWLRILISVHHGFVMCEQVMCSLEGFGVTLVTAVMTSCDVWDFT